MDNYYKDFNYCNALNSYSRRKTITVKIGDLQMGSDFPIRVQSMTTTNTLDTMATVNQSIKMIEAGCELVRITAPSIKEAKNLANIKKELNDRGYFTPIVADIHFTPNAAEVAARIVEKVRINPGNFADKKKFEIINYTDFDYEQELERIREKFIPLVKICKEYGTAMRIGTNHGSLSDRIMNRYGDSPEGMVESAMEFLRIAESVNYKNIVLSMKSSNPLVMISAYRLLINKMNQEDMYYPLHLGVTEAGEDEEGRIKSAIGIGTLLQDGIGDTIRVSLTEDPEFEMPVAIKLASRYSNSNPNNDSSTKEDTSNTTFNPFVYNRKRSVEVLNFGANNVPRVIADLSSLTEITPQDLSKIDYTYQPIPDKWHQGELGADYIYFGNQIVNFMLPNGAKAIYNYKTWITLKDNLNHYPLIEGTQINDIDLNTFNQAFFVRFDVNTTTSEEILKIKDFRGAVIILTSTNKSEYFRQIRHACKELNLNGMHQPIVFLGNYMDADEEVNILDASTDIGGPYAEGFGDGIFLKITDNLELSNRTAFNILQATRTRISKTEYISCPSCGRTLFDLQETTAKIRKQTDHLKGVKIAIMGCIVNGPGEMADADYGYVGVGIDKITLYRGKEVVKKNMSSDAALEELINLMKEDGVWIDREVFAA